MHISQHAPSRKKLKSGSCFDRTARLNLKAIHPEEQSYLAWIANQIRSGTFHRLYIQELAKDPNILNNLTDEDVDIARHVWNCICEGVPVNLNIDEARALEAKGLIYNVVELPGRGRYAGRFEFFRADRLEAVVYAAVQRTSAGSGDNEQSNLSNV